MSMRRNFRFFTTVTLALVILLITTTAFAATLSVTRVTQAKTMWCWAATSEMIGTYQNSDSTRDQWDVVKYLKGATYPNVGGSASDIEKGIKYASMDLVTYTSGSILSWSSHTSHIGNSNPIGVWLGWNSGGAHATVCAGTKTTTGTNYLYIIDPWEDTTSTWYSYDALKNGTTLLTGTGKYTLSFWKS